MKVTLTVMTRALIGLMIIFSCAWVHAGVLVVPSGQPAFDGQGPFFVTRDQFANERWQQFYTGSAIGALNPSPFYITEIAFSSAIGSLPIDTTLQNLGIRMSTTPFAADQHGNVFLANVG